MLFYDSTCWVCGSVWLPWLGWSSSVVHSNVAGRPVLKRSFHSIPTQRETQCETMRIKYQKKKQKNKQTNPPNLIQWNWLPHVFSTCPSLSSSALMSSSCCLVVHAACCSWADSSCSRSSQSFSQCSAESFVWAGTEVRKISFARSPSLFDQEVRSFWRYRNLHKKKEAASVGARNLLFNRLPSKGQRGRRPPCCPAAAPSHKSAACASSAAPGIPGGNMSSESHNKFPHVYLLSLKQTSTNR